MISSRCRLALAAVFAAVFAASALVAAGVLTCAAALRPAAAAGASVSAAAYSQGSAPVTVSDITVSALAVASAPNNPDFAQQWSLNNTGQVAPPSTTLNDDAPAGFAGTPGDDIDILGAWPSSLGAGVTVAVVDTGVDYNAPGLDGQLVGGYNFVEPGTLPQDDNGHGTHVSGIIAAAQNNGVGISGIAPEAKIMPLKALNSQGQGSFANLAAAFAYAGAHGIRIVNASLSALNPLPELAAAVRKYPNTLYVVAAGNADTNTNDLLTPAYPCDIAAANIICVGASDAANQPASFSDFSLIPASVTASAHVILFAPGVDILSTWLSQTAGGSCSPAAPCPRYAYQSGTSMAAPEVSGVLALMLAANPGLSAPQLKAALEASVRPVRTLYDLSETGGLLDASTAVAAALAMSPQPPPLAPLRPPARAHPLHWTGLRLSARAITCQRARCSPLRFAFTLSRRATVHLTLFALGDFSRRRVGALTFPSPRGSRIVTLHSLFAGRRRHPGFYQLRLQATSPGQATLVSLVTLQVVGSPA